MNFHAVATEIMLTANEEKWQETRDKIEYELRRAAGQLTFREQLDEYYCNWRDQPDGVR